MVGTPGPIVTMAGIPGPIVTMAGIPGPIVTMAGIPGPIYPSFDVGINLLDLLCNPPTLAYGTPIFLGLRFL